MVETVTMREAAALLGVSNTQIWRLVRDGILQATPNPRDRREKLIRLTDVERLRDESRPPRRFVSDGIVSVPDAPPAAQIEDYLREHWHR